MNETIRFTFKSPEEIEDILYIFDYAMSSIEDLTAREQDIYNRLQAKLDWWNQARSEDGLLK